MITLLLLLLFVTQLGWKQNMGTKNN